jgi:transposase
VRVGMEATGYSRWFERLLAELGFEVWMGDAAEIKAKRVKKQKFDREDARLLRRLMLENNFPQIWAPSPESGFATTVVAPHRLVQMRMRIMNQLQALAMNEGYRWKRKLFSEQGRALLEADRRRNGSWCRNYLSRRPGGFQNSGKGFLSLSHNSVRSFRQGVRYSTASTHFLLVISQTRSADIPHTSSQAPA